MSFSSSHSVTVPHPLDLTLKHLASPSTNEAVARLSPILTVYEDLGIDRVWITDDDLSPEMEGRRDMSDLELAPADSAVGQERTGPAGAAERVVERLRYRIVNEVVIPLYTHRVDTPGWRVYDPKTNTVVYTSTSTSSPLITTRWTRTFSPSPDDTEGATVVSEEIRGTGPGYLRWITERETRKSQQSHMGGYPSLFVK